MTSNDPKIIIALDYDSEEKALGLVKQLDTGSCRLKIGKELFTRAGPRLVEHIQGMGFEIFLDLKFHDIPNTVAKACAAAADLGVWMVNVHALGGRRMMEAAREAIDKSSSDTRLIAVTILTSMAGEDLQEIGLRGNPEDLVSSLAGLAQNAGLDGVVCSPREAGRLREQCGPDFQLVTPGVRPAGSDTGDQKRIMTPGDAIRAGSSYLVVGRPVTQAPDPGAALADIFTELG